MMSKRKEKGGGSRCKKVEERGREGDAGAGGAPWVKVVAGGVERGYGPEAPLRAGRSSRDRYAVSSPQGKRFIYLSRS